jgi:hypothetical protein
MLTVLTSIFGFLAPFLPEIIKHFNAKVANAHELAMLTLQGQIAKDQHAYRMEEITAFADIAEAHSLRQPQPSFGVQLLDAAKGYTLSQWLFAPAFYLFTLLDFVAGITRPGITWAVFGLYATTKYAQVWIGLMLAKADSIMKAQAWINVWTTDDLAILTLVLSYWFGQRAAKAAFGGNASHSAAGK